MRERFLFVTEIERAATREMLSDNFPLAKLWYVHDDTDFVMDTDFPCSEEVFFRYAAQAPGPSGVLIYSCLYLSLLMLNPPAWMAAELRKLQFRLPAST